MRSWLGLALVVLLPSWAEAQLFPNRTVTRERPPCASEPPFYSQVRQNYFGFYPTCWTRFPAGWACPCPNPELPNAAAEFARQKRDPLPEGLPDTGLDGMTDDATVPDPRPGDEAMPPVPNSGRSPFNSDPSAPDPGVGRPPRGSTLPPRGSDLPPQTSRSSSPAPAQTSAPRPAAPLASPPVPSATTGLLEMPRMLPPVTAAPPAQPTVDAGLLAMAPDATLASTSSVNFDRPNLGPLPAASTPDGSTPMGIDPSLLAQNQPTGATAPAQAPQRRGFLSGLFGSSKRRR